MTTRHYDVIILGRSIGALLTAALLARRELRVLLLGHGQQAPFYKVEEHLMCRRAFSLLSATSPAFRRILQELAQSQNFKRLTSPLNPMFAMLDGRIRFSVPPDVELFSREISREYPEIQQPIAELYAQISTANAEIDATFERDAIWPPGTMWERLETSRYASQLPLLSGSHTPLLARMPSDHKFRRVVELPALFASNLGATASDLDEFSLARLHGSWTRGIHSLARGEQELEDFLVARIEAHGGSCRLNGRAEELVIKRGRVAGIIEDGEETHTAAEAVITASSGETLANLSGGAGVTKKARENWPRVEVVGGRFVVSLVVARAGLPVPLPAESFFAQTQSSLPDLHVQRYDTEELTRRASGETTRSGADLSLLVAEMILPSTGGIHLLGAREAVLSSLSSYLPFLEEHLVMVDSPHDGLPVWKYQKNAQGVNQRGEIERIHLRAASPLPEPMMPRLIVSPRGYLGLGGEPLRGPIPGTYLIGPSVLPGLGQEGEVLAAWGVSRILTKKDGARQKMRRQMWTKIETG